MIDSHMKIQPLATFKFFNERGKLTGDYFIITAIGRPLSGKNLIDFNLFALWFQFLN